MGCIQQNKSININPISNKNTNKKNINIKNFNKYNININNIQKFNKKFEKNFNFESEIPIIDKITNKKWLKILVFNMFIRRFKRTIGVLFLLIRHNRQLFMLIIYILLKI